MGAAMEVIGGLATAPGATATALTMFAGNSNTVRQHENAKVTRLLTAWADVQAAGQLRIRSPKLHDAVQGIRLDTTIGDVSPLLPIGPAQRMWPNDPLTLDIVGSATAGDIESAALLLYYEDLPGVAARFIAPEEVNRRVQNIFTVENTLATGTAGGYSGEEALNAEFDLGQASVDYALLGYMVDVECLLVGWRGAETGNLRVAGPGNETLRHVTSEWFLRLSRMLAIPLVPVFNYTNRAGILVDAAQDENGADVTVTSIFAQLTPR